MPDYKSMYFQLAARVADSLEQLVRTQRELAGAAELLVRTQRELEEAYIRDAEDDQALGELHSL